MFKRIGPITEPCGTTTTTYTTTTTIECRVGEIIRIKTSRRPAHNNNIIIRRRRRRRRRCRRSRSINNTRTDRYLHVCVCVAHAFFSVFSPPVVAVSAVLSNAKFVRSRFTARYLRGTVSGKIKRREFRPSHLCLYHCLGSLKTIKIPSNWNRFFAPTHDATLGPVVNTRRFLRFSSTFVLWIPSGTKNALFFFFSSSCF